MGLLRIRRRKRKRRGSDNRRINGLILSVGLSGPFKDHEFKEKLEGLKAV
jgi:hypothetical protein